MNIYKPYRLKIDGSTIIVRDYALSFYPNYEHEEVILTLDNFYSGFLFEFVDGRYVVYDLRANEGMIFGGSNLQEIRDAIESYLHSYALDVAVEKARIEKQKARLK